MLYCGISALLAYLIGFNLIPLGVFEGRILSLEEKRCILAPNRDHHFTHSLIIIIHPPETEIPTEIVIEEVESSKKVVDCTKAKEVAHQHFFIKEIGQKRGRLLINLEEDDQGPFESHYTRGRAKEWEVSH